MKNLSLHTFSEVVLFDPNPSDKYQNHLKKILYFLKSNGHQGTIDFSYADHINSLHTNLSIKENFILDSIPTSLVLDNERNFNNFIEQLGNSHLIKLIEKIDSLDTKIKDLGPQDIGLTAFIKALIAPSEFVFLMLPEKNQDMSSIQLIKSAIEFEVEHGRRKFFIHSSKEEIWIDIISKTIFANKDGEYISTQNPFHKKGPAKSSLDFEFKILKAS